MANYANNLRVDSASGSGISESSDQARSGYLKLTNPTKFELRLG